MEEFVKIDYNQNEEMMKISFKGECIFYGNYWDFKRSPFEINSFLLKLGMSVHLSNSLEDLG